MRLARHAQFNIIAIHVVITCVLCVQGIERWSIFLATMLYCTLDYVSTVWWPGLAWGSSWQVCVVVELAVLCDMPGSTAMFGWRQQLKLKDFVNFALHTVLQGCI